MCRAVIAAALAGFALSGCASTKPVEAPSNFAWSYSVNPGEGAKLAFGRPQSDEVVLMMVCAEPGASVMLSAAGLNTAQLMLTSGQSSTSVKGEVGEGFAGAGGLVEASLSSRAPALDGFKRSGDLTMTAGGRTIDLAASDADRSAVRRFFNQCQSA